MKKMMFDAAMWLAKNTARSGKNIPGNVPFSIDDIIYLLHTASQDAEFVKKYDGTGITFGKAIKQVAIDLLEIMNKYVVAKRIHDKYKGKLAYELSQNELQKLTNAIRLSLSDIYDKTKKRIKISSSQDKTHTEIINKVIDYIVSNQAKLKSSEKFYDVVKKYAGSSKLIWPSINVELKSGDEYKSLFKYLDKIDSGEERKDAESIINKYKNEVYFIFLALVISMFARVELGLARPAGECSYPRSRI
jgi:hypothetical protein